MTSRKKRQQQAAQDEHAGITSRTNPAIGPFLVGFPTHQRLHAYRNDIDGTAINCTSHMCRGCQHKAWVKAMGLTSQTINHHILQSGGRHNGSVAMPWTMYDEAGQARDEWIMTPPHHEEESRTTRELLDTIKARREELAQWNSGIQGQLFDRGEEVITKRKGGRPRRNAV